MKQSYNNGTSWYRVYSDGWIEQGGELSVANNNNWAYTTLTFLKAFSNANYTITATPQEDAYYAAWTFGFNNKTASNIKIGVIHCYGKVSWYACGY